MSTTGPGGREAEILRAHQGPERRLHAIVAVKSLRTAKSRLADELDSDARADLVLAMLHDTLATVSAVPAIDAVTVVTPDPTVAALAYSAGVGVYADPTAEFDSTSAFGTSPFDTSAFGTSAFGQVSAREPSDSASPLTEDTLNTALRATADHIRTARGLVDLVVLQADLPAMQPKELSEAVAAARTGGRSIVVDHHGTGTSALFSCGPESSLDPQFGPESARGHVNSGARRLSGEWPGLRTDVDTHADLEAVRALGVGPATLASLIRLDSSPSNTR